MTAQFPASLRSLLILAAASWGTTCGVGDDGGETANAAPQLTPGPGTPVPMAPSGGNLGPADPGGANPGSPDPGGVNPGGANPGTAPSAQGEPLEGNNSGTNNSGQPTPGSPGTPPSPAGTGAPNPAEPNPDARAPSVPTSCTLALPGIPATAAATLSTEYAAWKEAYVADAGDGALRVVATDKANGTVSEGIAYGMLLAAYLDDRAVFDGLFAYAKRHLDANGLMNWLIGADGTVQGKGAATDADEDIALALVVADKRWSGYSEPAKAMIQAILDHEVEELTWLLKPGDTWGGRAVTNPSYFSPAYYRVFAAYTGNQSWLKVTESSYGVLDKIDAASASSETGLYPDWCTADGTPAGGKGYNYTYDAIRLPWRLAMDALWFQEPRAKSRLERLNAFWIDLGAANIKDGYALNGDLVGMWHNAAFVGPAAVGVAAGGNADASLSFYDELTKLPDESYYATSLKLISLLAISGAMPHPDTFDQANCR